MSTVLVAVLLLTYAVVTGAGARNANAVAELPPGGIVSSTANFGWTQGQFSVSDDGAAQYSVPLWVPPGRGTVAPSLSLSYNSRAGNGPVGVGWALGGLSSISWCPRTFAQDGFTESGHFDGTSALCLGGTRLLPVSPRQLPEREYKTEKEMFARIIAYGTQDNVPDYFRVWTKEGQILTFGETNLSRLRAYRLRGAGNLAEPYLEKIPAADRVTAAWAVNRIEDRNGNAATVEYTGGEGDATLNSLWWVDLRPSVIRYAPNRRVEFGYEGRPDVVDGFGGGIHTRLSHRLKRIVMYGGPQGGVAEKLREYELAYLDEDNDSITGRSLLASITERDHEGRGKQPLTFDWTRGGYGFQEVDGGPFPGTSGGGVPVVADVDGDGRSDIITRSGGTTWVKRSTGVGFLAPVASPPGDLFSLPVLPYTTSPLRPVDTNSDGRTELMAHVPDADGFRWTLYNSNGSTFAKAPGGGIDDWLPGEDAGQYRVYFGDMDGNGAPDFLGTRPTRLGAAQPWHYRMNTGSAGSDQFGGRRSTTFPNGTDYHNVRVFDTDGDGRAEIVTPHAEDGANAWGMNAAGGLENAVLNIWQLNSVGDVNGDGLSDVVSPVTWNDRQDRVELRVQLNSGNGFGSRLAASSPEGYSYDNSYSGVRVVDFNNDGRDDVLQFHPGAAVLYVWRGNRFERIDLTVRLDPHHGGRQTEVLDFDGDGVLDLLSYDLATRRYKVFKRVDGMPDRITGFGDAAVTQRVEVGYTTLADRTTHTPATDCVYPLVCTAAGGSVVSWHRTAIPVRDNDIVWKRYNHDYAGARTDVHGRGWLGFASHTVSRFNEATVTEFDNKTRAVGATSEYARAESYPYAGLAKKVTYTAVDDQTGGREFRRTAVNDNEVRRLPNGSITVEQQGATVTEQERPLGATGWQTLRTTTNESMYDAFGNVDLAVSRTDGGRTVTDDPTYRNDQSAWLLGLTTAERSTACTAANVCTTRKTAHDYDGKGNLTLSVLEPDRPALKLSTVTAYGDFGVVTSVTSTDSTGVSRRERFEYGNADKLVPTATFNALDHKTMVETHSGLGVPLRTTDPNRVVTTMTYDWFGRLRQTNHADGAFERITHAMSGGWQQTTTSTSGGGRNHVLVDQVGKERKRQVLTFGGQFATTYTEYDNAGRVYRVSRPALSGSPLQNTTYTYDDRDRLIKTTEPDGAVTRTEYIGRETHAYDARNVHSYTVATVDGDIESRYEDDPSSTAWLRTRFEYGPFGETTKMTAADGTAQSMRYDVAGRRDRLVDPTTGTTLFSYNAFGEVLTETDNAGAVTGFTYDALGRVVKTIFADGMATNTWDTAPHGIGLLASAKSADGTNTVQRYDEFGHTETTTWHIAGSAYEVAYAYDVVGRPLTMTYPQIPGAQGRLAVKYGYTSSGYLSRIADAANDQAYWTAEARDAAGQLTRERFGNNAATNYTYQRETGLLDQIATTGPGNVGLVDLRYGYDLNRNVSERHDVINDRLERFAFDALNRLTAWRKVGVPGGAVQMQVDYTYDKLGNLKTEKTTGNANPDITYRYGDDGAPPHALTSRNSATYGYDDLGRQTAGPQRTVSYTGFDLPKTIAWGQGKNTAFTYDANNARVRKQDADQTVVYVPGVLERRTPAGTEIHNLHQIMVEGRLVAQVNRVQASSGGAITATRVSYVHTDRQASTVKVTNPAGRPVGDDTFLSDLFYDPFGRRIDAQYKPVTPQRHGGPRQGYTGHEHDDEYSLINMKGRIYDPEARRFLSADPLVQHPLSSQSHNRYAYVWNNPTTLTDPSGFSACGDGSGTLHFLSCSGSSSAHDITGMLSARALLGGLGFNVVSLTEDGVDDDTASAGAIDQGGVCEATADTCDLPDEEALPEAPSWQAPQRLGDLISTHASDSRAKPYRGSIERLSPNELERFVNDFSHYGVDVEDADLKVALLSYAQKVHKLRRTVEIGSDGKQRTQLEGAVKRRNETNDAELSTMAAPIKGGGGNPVSGGVFFFTGSVGAAKMAGAGFDVAGEIPGMVSYKGYQLTVIGADIPNEPPAGTPGAYQIQQENAYNLKVNGGYYPPLQPSPIE